MARKQQARVQAVQEAPPDTGAFHRQLAEPQLVGEITHGEAREIKALNELQKRLTEDLQHAQRVVNVAGMHRLEFLRSLLSQRGLGQEDLYSIDDDSGHITRTHELVTPSLQVVSDEAVAEVEAISEATDVPLEN